MTLPEGQKLATETPEVKTENADLASAIARSAEQIEAQQTAPLKRGRGRPKKVKPEATGPSVGTAAPGAPSVEAVPPMDLRPMLASVIKLPFDIAASKTHCPVVKLTDDEAKDPADLANQLFNAYAPELAAQDPKRVLLFSFSFTICMLAVSKATAYAEWKTRTVEQTVTQTTAEGSTTQTTVRTESQPPPTTNQAPPPPAEPFDPFRRGAGLTQ